MTPGESDGAQAAEPAEPGGPLASPPRTRLEQLTPGARVTGLAGAGAVQVVAIRWVGANAQVVTYADDQGRTGQAIANRDLEPRLHLDGPARSHAFDGDAES